MLLLLTHFLRSFHRKGISAYITLLGLCIGVASVILIIHFVHQEYSYDRFLSGSELIYRVSKWVTVSDKETNVALTEGKLADFLRDEAVSVKNATRVLKIRSEFLLTADDKSFLEKNGMISDSSFLDVFQFDFLHGDRNTSLDNPNAIVLTKDFSIKLFGVPDAINKSITIEDNAFKTELIVTGVLETIPDNSSLRFDFLISGATFPFWKSISENASPFYTFYKLHTDADNRAVAEGLPRFQNRVNAGRTNPVRYDTQALPEVHFNGGLLFDFTEKHNKSYVDVCFLLGFILAIITIFNYINLFGTYAVDKVKVLAVQKILGGTNTLLVVNFFAAAFFYTMISFIVSLVFAELSLNYLAIDFFNGANSLFSFELLFMLTVAAIGIAVIAALYLVILLTKVNLAESLKWKIQLSTRKRFSFRGVALVLQTCLTILLVSWMVLISRQLKFMEDVDQGYSSSQIICVSRNSAVSPQEWTSLYNTLNSSASVIDVFSSQYYIYDDLNADVLKTLDGDNLEVKWNAIDDEFVPAMGMSIVFGRNFSERFPGDTTGMLMNETAFNQLRGYSENPMLPFSVVSRGDTFQVVGVVKDFYYSSFNNKIEPLVFYLNRQVGRNFYMKLSSADGIDEVREIWNKTGMRGPFEYKVLDESFAEIFNTEVNLRNVSLGFSSVSIIITIISLMGFLAYMFTAYKHVYAIKRVFGASVRSIFKELMIFQLKVIALSVVLIGPVIYSSMNTWLSGFAYKVSISWFDFFIAVILVMGTAVAITVIYVMKYARLNPSVILSEN